MPKKITARSRKRRKSSVPRYGMAGPRRRYRRSESGRISVLVFLSGTSPGLLGSGLEMRQAVRELQGHGVEARHFFLNGFEGVFQHSGLRLRLEGLLVEGIGGRLEHQNLEILLRGDRPEAVEDRKSVVYGKSVMWVW